jgi:hypothetical protein
MKRRITPCPSPNGTNHARAFLVHIPAGRGPVGALDAMRKHGDEDMPDVGRLRVELDEILARSLSDQDLEEARGLIAQHLGSSEEYDRAHTQGEDEDDDEDLGGQGGGRAMPAKLRKKMRDFLTRRGATDSEVDELFQRLDDETATTYDPAREDGMTTNAEYDRSQEQGEDDDLGEMPRNARQGGLGGRLARDQKRLARDRRRQMAADEAYSNAQESFEKLFPESKRIGLGGA